MRRVNVRFAGVLLAILVLSRDTPAADRTVTTQPCGRLREVIVVCKQHFDIGYTDYASNVLEYYRTTMIDRALAVCDATRTLPSEQRFVWTLPGWPMAEMIGPRQTADRRERILAAMREGRLVVHALPASLHTDSLELEDVVRGLGYASRLSRSLGLPLPRDGKMTDVPSHVWLMPTVLARAGVDFFHFAGNKACRRPDLPLLFWWEGPDGSRVLSMQTKGYGTQLLPPPDWPHATWLAVMHTGDNHGPPDAAAVRAMIDEVSAKCPGAKVRMGRLSDFADAILREEPDLPVVRADVPDYWIHGVMSLPQATKTARNVRPRIGALESLATHLRAWGVAAPDVKETVAKAYEQSLLYGEHTWGMATLTHGLAKVTYGEEFERARASGQYKTIEASWQEHAEYIRNAERLVGPALAECMTALARAVNVEGPRIVVYNPLPWTRSDDVAVDASGVPPSARGMKELFNGAVVPIERDARTVRFHAAGVPSLGYATFVPTDDVPQTAPAQIEAPQNVLENRFFRVTLDPARGTIASLVDKQTRRELVDPASPLGFGRYLYERFDTDDREAWLNAYTDRRYDHADRDFGKLFMAPASEAPHVTAYAGGFSLEMRSGPLTAEATMRAAPGHGVPHAVTLTVTLYAELPCVDVEWSIRDKQAEPWPEAGWLCFAAAMPEPRFFVGRLGSVIDPGKDVVRGSNRDVLCVNTGVMMLSRDGRGLGLCPVDSPLVSLDRPGLWKYSPDFEPQRPIAYVNLFNNLWSTNFAQWIEGSWSSRVRLWTCPSFRDPILNLVSSSWEARTPFLTSAATGAGGTLPVFQSGLSVRRPGVLVTAFDANPDGDGTLLRLWEQSGQRKAFALVLPAGLDATKARPVDLRGRPQGEPIPIENGRFVINAEPYAPTSVVLTK